MPTLSLVWGILAIFGMFLGFIPCLGAFNWLNIPFAAVGAIVAGVTLGNAPPESRGVTIFALIACMFAVFFGGIRLLLGGGLL